MIRLACSLLVVVVLVASAGDVRSSFTAATRADSSFRAAAVFPPKNVTPPSLSGTARIGVTLVARLGSWRSNPSGYEVRWERSTATGWEVVGTTLARTLTGDDAGRRLRVRVVAVNAGGRSAPAFTDAVRVDGPEPSALRAEPQDVRLEHIEHTRGAQDQLGWRSARQPREAIPAERFLPTTSQERP